MTKYFKYVGLFYPVGLLVSVAHLGYDLSNWFAGYCLCVLAFASPFIINLIDISENE